MTVLVAPACCSWWWQPQQPVGGGVCARIEAAALGATPRRTPRALLLWMAGADSLAMDMLCMSCSCLPDASGAAGGAGQGRELSPSGVNAGGAWPAIGAVPGLPKAGAGCQEAWLRSCGSLAGLGGVLEVIWGCCGESLDRLRWQLDSKWQDGRVQVSKSHASGRTILF